MGASHADPNRLRDGLRPAGAAPMLLMLATHPEREATVRRPGGLRVEPEVPVDEFTDGFGNRCAGCVAPAGPAAALGRPIVEDGGLPDAVAPDAVQHPVEELPADVLRLPARAAGTARSTGSRDIAWELFGQTPRGLGAGAGGLRLGPRPRHVRLPVRPADQDGLRRLRRSGTGVCRDFTHLALTFCRCLNIPARYATGYLGDIGVPPSALPDGLQRLVRGLPRRPLVHVRRPPQHPADRPRADGPRPRRRRRRPDHLVRRRPTSSKFIVWTDEVSDHVPSQPPRPTSPPPCSRRPPRCSSRRSDLTGERREETGPPSSSQASPASAKRRRP